MNARSLALAALALLLAGCTLPVTRPSPERLIAQAEEMVRAGDYRGAQEAYRRALSDFPKNSSTDRALFGLARLYVTPENPGRDYRRAYENFERLLTEHPESVWEGDARAWRELLSAYLSQREEAERARQEAQRVRKDLERLKEIEMELERQRRR